MEKCFECKTTDIKFVCGSGEGDYFCHDCAAEYNFECPFCGHEFLPIENKSLE